MERTQYVHVSEAITSAILERERVHPLFLHRNPDNTFTAVFDEAATPQLYESIQKAADSIVLLESDVIESPDADEGDYEPTTVRFGFIAEPLDYS